jgi:hypothetical protein
VRGTSREVAQKLFEFVRAQDQGLDPAFAEERIADTQFCFLAVGAAGIVVDDPAEVLAGVEPVLLQQKLGAPIVEELVSFGLAHGGEADLGTAGAQRGCGKHGTENEGRATKHKRQNLSPFDIGVRPGSDTGLTPV